MSLRANCCEDFERQRREGVATVVTCCRQHCRSDASPINIDTGVLLEVPSVCVYSQSDIGGVVVGGGDGGGGRPSTLARGIELR